MVFHLIADILSFLNLECVFTESFLFLKEMILKVELKFICHSNWSILFRRRSVHKAFLTVKNVCLLAYLLAALMMQFNVTPPRL